MASSPRASGSTDKDWRAHRFEAVRPSLFQMTGAAHLSFGLVNGRPIFMDDQNDAYFQLDSEEEARFLEEIGNRSSVAPEKPSCTSAFGLEDAQIVRADPPAPDGSVPDQLARLGRPSVRDVLRAAELTLAARWQIAHRPISRVLSDLAAQHPRGETGAVYSSLAEKAQKFFAARRLIPLSPHCLSDSLALLRWLGPAPGLRLIFGVKRDPFEAHCWVQLHELLINERPDQVAPFRAVRVIECTPALR